MLMVDTLASSRVELPPSWSLCPPYELRLNNYLAKPIALPLFLAKPEHQAHVLHRCTGSAFTKIVQSRDENGLTAFVAGKDV
jgi:hypothetical protein